MAALLAAELRGGELPRLAIGGIKRSHLYLAVSLAAVKHQAVVHTAEVERVVELAILVLKIIVPPCVNPLVCGEIREHHRKLLNPHDEAIKSHEGSMCQQGNGNHKSPWCLVILVHKKRHMDGKIKRHLKRNPKQKNGEISVIFLPHAIIHPGTMMVKPGDALVAKLTMF